MTQSSEKQTMIFLPESVADTYRNSDIEVVKNYVN
jgi:hypothetical protein